MRFRILGPLAVQDRYGEPVSLQALKQRALLLVLLLHADKPVSIGRLEAALWPDRPPRSAAALIRTYVSGLRSMLGLKDAQQIPRLAKEPDGYRLTLAPADLDLAVFDDLSARGRHALSRGDAAQAARLLSDALALWRGEPGGGITLDEECAAILAGLAERRLVAEEAWAAAQLELGSGADLIGKLRSLVAEQPLRERARGQLMLALYRSGRKAEALEEFLSLRRRMADELGIEPSALTRKLHRRILADDPALISAQVPAAIPRQLPHGTGDFTGREAELGAMTAMLPGTDATAPAITLITGMAGVGKTALAVHFAYLVADRFPDGQLFLDLHGHADAEPVPSAEGLRRFVRALGAKEIPSDTDEIAALYRSLLADRRMIILLDNAADASQVRVLLPGSPHCLVLVTSRSRLPGLLARDSATAVTVEPLTATESITLLRKALGAPRVDADPDATATIVARCARLPLALRIVAERAAHRPQLALATLAGELVTEQQRLNVLTTDEDGYSTVRLVFSWSYRKLAPAAARMFRLLSLHPGPDISVPAAAALADTSVARASRLLELLADMHLAEEAAPSRYRFHALVCDYAAERAAEDESMADRTAAIRRMLAWYLYTADAANRLLAPARRHVPLGFTRPDHAPPLLSDYAQALAWCDAEHANLVAAIRAAVEAGEDEIAWRLPVALASFFELRKPRADMDRDRAHSG